MGQDVTTPSGDNVGEENAEKSGGAEEWKE
jgi:hypothetical protein